MEPWEIGVFAAKFWIAGGPVYATICREIFDYASLESLCRVL